MSDKKIISKFFNFIEKLDCIDKLNIRKISLFFSISSIFKLSTSRNLIPLLFKKILIFFY